MFFRGGQAALKRRQQLNERLARKAMSPLTTVIYNYAIGIDKPEADAKLRAKLKLVLMRLYVNTREVIASAMMAELPTAEKTDGDDNEWTRGVDNYLAQHAAATIAGISETIRDDVRKIIAAAVGAKKKPNEAELAQQLHHFSRARAAKIARTEQHIAGNTTSHAIAKKAGVKYKIWLASIHDRRTRSTHRAANNQKRPFDKPFKVGGADLQHPGDARGPAREVINCRCASVYAYR